MGKAGKKRGDQKARCYFVEHPCKQLFIMLTMMKKEQIVGARLPQSLINDLEKIERVDQSDRSTTLRKLLSGAIREWKLDY